jgi:TolB protein
VAPPSLAGSVLFIANRGSPAEVPTTGPVTPGSGGYNIWVMNADGHEERALTTTSHDAQPALAPDGVHIAWIVSNNQVWTMTSDGAAQKKVASCPQACGTPRWSPDGTRIAYTAQSGNGDVVVIDADGAHPRQYKTAIDAYGVSWSPDGQRLAVNVSGAPDVAGLWVMSVATGVEKRIRTGNTAAPAWSPDGSTILFSDGTNLFTMAPDGTGLKQRTSGGGQYLGGSWSRDGHTLVFDFFPGRAGAHQQVGSMGVDGSNLRALTDGTDDCYESTT